MEQTKPSIAHLFYTQGRRTSSISGKWRQHNIEIVAMTTTMYILCCQRIKVVNLQHQCHTPQTFCGIEQSTHSTPRQRTQSEPRELLICVWPKRQCDKLQCNRQRIASLNLYVNVNSCTVATSTLPAAPHSFPTPLCIPEFHTAEFLLLCSALR